MPANPASKPPQSPDSTQAVEHLSRARQVLKSLRETLENAEHHAQLDEAITKIELALSALTIQTGGFL
jgi:hypothetical protein